MHYTYFDPRTWDDNSMGVALGIDVGGTKIAAGVVDDGGQIIARVRRPSRAADASSIVATILEVAQELTEEHRPSAIGVGAAGFIDATRRTVVFAPNIAWRDEPLADKLEEATGLPTVVENDANTAAWGEFQFGVATDASSIVFITLGTGIGGGIIMNGKLLTGGQGYAGEIGHLNVVPGGKRCGCGLLGCWEQYGSGTALVRLAKESAELNPDMARTLLGLVDGDATQITGYTVTQAAQLQCQAALGAIDSMAGYTAQALSDLSLILDPEMFVLAGGVSEAGDVVRNPITKAFRSYTAASGRESTIPIVTATLGNDAGIIGAADLSRVKASGS